MDYTPQHMAYSTRPPQLRQDTLGYVPKYYIPEEAPGPAAPPAKCACSRCAPVTHA